MKNFYTVLRIAPDSTMADIKAAYRELAKKFHPDRGGDPRLFCDIQEAYDVLSDEKLKRSYDEQMRRIPFDGMPYRTVTPSLKTEPVDVYDDLVDVLARRFGLGRRSRLAGDIILSRREAETGANLELEIPIQMICERCFGFGGTIISVCGKCRGSGVIDGSRKAYLSIDPGAREGDVVMSRAGNIEAYFRILVER
jgi:molecular chaperone DnaJ